MTKKTAAIAVNPKPAKPEKANEMPGDKISEKITINMGFVDLGQVDLLVSEGFYGNRTDFIRTAIRNQIGTHADAVKQVVARKTLVLGLQHFSAADLQAVKAARQMLAIRVLGLATIANDVTPALALATIESLEVLGALHASAAVKAALAGRMR
jgi:Arc/MetJ-type ribon-helix-helix transcriptional regulator